MLTFYNRYLEACADRNVSPSFVAEAAGLSRAASSGWKKGALPSDANLNKLAKYLEIPVSEFLKCDDIMERNHQKEIKERAEREAFEENNGMSEDKKITATNGDGIDIDVSKLHSDKEELKKLVDRLTPEEVAHYIDDIRRKILGL